MQELGKRDNDLGEPSRQSRYVVLGDAKAPPKQDPAIDREVLSKPHFDR